MEVAATVEVAKEGVMAEVAKVAALAAERVAVARVVAAKEVVTAVAMAAAERAVAERGVAMAAVSVVVSVACWAAPKAGEMVEVRARGRGRMTPRHRGTTCRRHTR